MKTRTLISICIVFIVGFSFIGGCTTGKKLITDNDAMKILEGVYVNTESSVTDHFHPQKFVITSDGRFEYWIFSNQEYPTASGQYKVAKSWMDSKGNMYFFVDTEYYVGDKSQDLWKLDKSGNTLEVNYRMAGSVYPKRINPNPRPKDFNYEYYFILYCQE